VVLGVLQGLKRRRTDTSEQSLQDEVSMNYGYSRATQKIRAFLARDVATVVIGDFPKCIAR